MNQEAAREEVRLMGRAQRNKWCPLSGTLCRTECVVYIKAKMIEVKTGEWDVRPGYCNAYSLIGK